MSLHLINFKKQFAPAVEAFTKRQTMRPRRKRPIRVGDMLRAYTGLRTKYARRLWFDDQPVKSVERIKIGGSGVLLYRRGQWYPAAIGEMVKLALADGFKSIAEMRGFFREQYGLPVELDLIKW